jgi:radical SAM superfamily enzyme YgiQ (UPF0313 family)
MIGLPTETSEDLEEMLALVKKIWKTILAVGRAKGRMSNITMSVNSFVPKAWTPFQFHSIAPPAELKSKIKFLRKAVARQPNTRLAADQPKQAFMQAVIARGDRRVGRALMHVALGRGNWYQSLKKEGVRSEDFVLRTRGQEELFAWEILDQGIDREYLWREYQRGLAGKLTEKCDTQKCRRCGVCNDG